MKAHFIVARQKSEPVNYRGNFKRGKISILSHLAKLSMKYKVGDKITFKQNSEDIVLKLLILHAGDTDLMR